MAKIRFIALTQLPSSTLENSVYFIKPEGSESVSMYVTDANGNAKPVSVADVVIQNTIQAYLDNNAQDFEGPPGDPGISAYQVWLDNGNNGTVTDYLNSLKGAPGKSAYELAVENGFVGTVSDWLNQTARHNGNAIGVKYVLGTSDNQDFALIANNQERVIIKNSGLIGLGVDPTPFYAKKFVVNADGGVDDGITIYNPNATGANMIAFADGTTSNSRYAGFIGYNHALNMLNWGTAGTPKAWLFSDGNFSLGNSSNAGYKLDVQGTARFTSRIEANGFLSGTETWGVGSLSAIELVKSYSTFNRGVFVRSTIGTSGVGGASRQFTSSYVIAANSAHTDIINFEAGNPTVNTGGTVGTFVGFSMENTTAAGFTNIYAFRGSQNFGTGKWNLMMDGSAANFLGSVLHLGTQSGLRRFNILNSLQLTGSSIAYAQYTNGAAQSDVTVAANGYASQIGTAAASFTLSSLSHFTALQGVFGAGSVVNQQTGYDTNHLNATIVNIGFRGRLSSGTGKWNNYHEGTANNYFGGRVLVKTFTDAGFDLDVFGTGRISSALTLGVSGSTAGSLTIHTTSGNPTFVFEGNTGIVRARSGYLAWLPYDPSNAVMHFNIAHNFVGATQFTWGATNDTTLTKKIVGITRGGMRIDDTQGTELLNPSSLAVLDVTSTTKGLGLPVMTQAQALAIAGSRTGLLAFTWDQGGLMYKIVDGVWKGFRHNNSTGFQIYDAGWKNLDLTGTRANRPASGKYVGEVYYQTDEYFGFYRWDGTLWIYLRDQSDVSSGWNGFAGMPQLIGNGGSWDSNTPNGFGTVGEGRTGVNTNGWGGIGGPICRVDSGKVAVKQRISILSLSDGTESHYCIIGVGMGTGEPTRGAYFRYSHDVNGGRFEAKYTATGSSYVAKDTGITVVAAQFYETVIMYSPTEIKFYIDGVLVSTITTGEGYAPATYIDNLGGGKIQKSAGTTTRTIRIALTQIKQERSNF